MRHRNVLSLAFLLALALIVNAAGGAGLGTTKPNPRRMAIGTGHTVERSTHLFGDVLDVVAASRLEMADTTVRPARAMQAALDEVDRLGAMLNVDDPASELRRLNETATDDRFACSDDLFALLESARALAEQTEGAYDPAAGSLARLWSGHVGRDEPQRADVSDARGSGCWRAMLLDPERRSVRLMRPGLVVDPGPASAGYVLDRAADVLRRNGVVRAKLEAGLRILTFTPREPWIVSVPGAGGGPAFRVALANAACATAMTDVPGAEPAFDPRTGQRVRGPAVVTVIGRGASRTAALAAALLVLGREAAAAHARRDPDTGVIWQEPAGDPQSARVWAWNFSAIEPEPGLRVEWMARP
jgi:thiamine biosynthesis lipoprotein